MGINLRQPIRMKLVTTPALHVRHVFALGEVCRRECSNTTKATPTMEPVALIREKSGVVLSLTHSFLAQNLSIEYTKCEVTCVHYCVI
jgi:hypothetical protein